MLSPDRPEIPQPATDGLAGIVAGLARPRDLRTLRAEAMHLVMAMRLCALFLVARRDPVAELATRFGSVPVACHVLDLSRAIAAFWPERYVASRPCCLRLSPDENTVAAMAGAVLDHDRAGFTRALDGFVRTDRHEALHVATIRAVAALADLPRG